MKRRGYIPMTLSATDEYRVREVLAGRMCDRCHGTAWPMKVDATAHFLGVKVCKNRTACEARMRVAEKEERETKRLPRSDRNVNRPKP